MSRVANQSTGPLSGGQQQIYPKPYGVCSFFFQNRLNTYFWIIEPDLLQEKISFFGFSKKEISGHLSLGKITGVLDLMHGELEIIDICLFWIR